MDKINLTGRIPSLLKPPLGTAVSRRKEGDRPDNKQKKESSFSRSNKNLKPEDDTENNARKKKSTLPKKRGNSIDIEA